MTEVLDYDKMNWNVFAIGIGLSLLILYYFHFDPNFQKCNPILGMLGLYLGFLSLIYSFCLVHSYNKKKSILIKILKEEFRNKVGTRNFKKITLDEWMANNLNNIFFLRTKF